MSLVVAALSGIACLLVVMAGRHRPDDVRSVFGGPGQLSSRSTPEASGFAARSVGVVRQTFWRLHGRPPVTAVRARRLLELLDAVAPALRAGLPPAAAIRAVQPPGTVRRPDVTEGDAGGQIGEQDPLDPLDPLVAELIESADRGAPLGSVWRRHAQVLGSVDLALAGAAWSLCDTLGSPLAPTIATVCDVARRRAAVQQRIDVAVAGPRATVRVLSALPVAGPLIALAVGLDPLQLYADPLALASLGLGVILLLVGRWWCRRLVSALTRDEHLSGRRRRRQPRRAPSLAVR